MKSPNLTQILTNKPGRPTSTRRKAESLIGTAGVAAMAAADLHIVGGAIIRELALLLREPVENEPEKQTEGE